MQLSVIRTRVSQRLNEGATGPIYYPAAEINAAINEGLRFFCLLSLGLESTVTWTPGVTFTHMLGLYANWLAPLRIADLAGNTVRAATLRDMASLDPAWIWATGTVTRYVSLGCDLIGIYPTSATPLSVTYARAPVTLVADSDIPEIPAEYHPALVKYGIYRCRQGEGLQEFQKTLNYFSEFLDAAHHFGEYVRARNQGADYDKGPFELGSFDRTKLVGHK